MESLSQSGYNQGLMRRGTHSCVECRKRKIRCLYDQSDQNVCITCKSKNRVCQEQKREHFPSASTGRKKRSLKDRVAKLEALLNSSGIDANDAGVGGAGETVKNRSAPRSTPGVEDFNRPLDSNSSYRSDSPETEDEDEDEGEYNADPLVSLFNNRLLRSNEPKRSIMGPDTYQPNIDIRANMKRGHVLNILRTSLVSSELLRDILAVTSDWFQGWRPLGPWPVELTVAAGYPTLQDFLLFAYNSDIPAVVGVAILCIAESIRKLQIQTPAHAELMSQLQRPPQELFQILFERVDRMVNCDSDFANTREGFDCLLMSGKLFTSVGLPRRTWITFHKAIIYGQHHGLHRALPRVGETEAQRLFRQGAWDNLCQTDLFLSMTLGLPYITSGRNIPMDYFGPLGSGERFQKQMMSAATMVIDRNQSGLINELDPCLEIMKTLEEAAAPMAAEFWSSPDLLMQSYTNPAPPPPQYKRKLIEETRWQMFYWLIKIFTHLPLSIKSIDEPDFNIHRLACETGCRGMVKIYNILRNDKKSDLANVIDYQAFISCSILILGLLGYGNPAGKSSEELIQEQADRELVDITLHTLRSASETSANAVAGQALEGLVELFQLVQSTAGAQGIDSVALLQRIKTKIKIPYIGTIMVGPKRTMQKSRSRSVGTPSEGPGFTLMQPDVFPSSKVPGFHMTGTQPPITSNSIAPGTTAANWEGYEGEYTSIDFDFDQLMAMNSGDWTWISGEIPAGQYY